MGRALFSQKYSTTPAVTVRTEPEPSVGPYEKWSIWNYFDPDSNEFFQNAQREVFTDTDEYRLEQAEFSAMAVDGGTESSASSEANESDRSSPMAVGPDDPAIMIADAWEHRFLIAADVDWRRSREDHQLNEPASLTYAIPPHGSPGLPNISTEEIIDHARSVRANRPRSATMSSVSSGSGFFPPSSLRNSTTATDIDAEAPNSPSQPTPSLRRTVNIAPINIPTEPSTPSPVSSDSPSTPTDNLYSRQLNAMLTPSPPPSVTPHIYTWNPRALTIPASPLAAHGAAGPLTNPNARMSLARINMSPVRVRVQNAAV